MSLATADSLGIWLIDHSGNIAVSATGLALLGRVEALHVPAFNSTEQAIAWGSCLDAEEHDSLLEMQRTLGRAASEARDPQLMVDLATRSQLIREAAEAFVPGYPGKMPAIFIYGSGPAYRSSTN
jgi:hypothetical protein